MFCFVAACSSDWQELLEGWVAILMNSWTCTAMQQVVCLVGVLWPMSGGACWVNNDEICSDVIMLNWPWPRPFLRWVMALFCPVCVRQISEGAQEELAVRIGIKWKCEFKTSAFYWCGRMWLQLKKFDIVWDISFFFSIWVLEER